MSSSRAALVALAIGLAIISWLRPGPTVVRETEPRWTTLDRRELAYPEDEGGKRVVGRIEGVLELRGSEVRVRIIASAVAPGIDPPEGFRGVHGSNRITAREITKLLATGELSARTELEDPDLPALAGRVGAGRRGGVAERQLGAGNTLSMLGESDAVMVLETWAHSAALPVGRSATELVARGKPRLRAIVRVTHDAHGNLGGKIEELSAVSGHHHPPQEHP